MSNRQKDDSTKATFRDVLEEEYEDVRAMVSAVPMIQNALDHRLSLYYDPKGNARFSFPPEANDSPIAQAFLVRCGEWVKNKTKRSRILNAAELYQDVGAPSAFGKPSGWSKWQTEQNDLPIMCSRPSEKSWLNIRIMHPVFHQISDILENGKPTTTDYVMAAELCTAMPEAYVVENSRRDAINRIFNKYLASSASSAIGVNCIANAFDTDGTSEEAGFNVEFKNEKGKDDSDPYMQNIGYYLQY